MSRDYCPLDDQQAERFAEDWANPDLHHTEVAERWGKGWRTIYRWAKALELPARPDGVAGNFQGRRPAAGRKYDWERIKAEWATGRLTLAEMSIFLRVPISSIRAKAKAEDWGARPKNWLLPHQPTFDISGKELPPPPKEMLTGPRINRYTRPWAERICEAVIQGWSLEDVCKLPGSPAYMLVARWLVKPEFGEFQEMYRQALEASSFFELARVQSAYRMAMETARSEGLTSQEIALLRDYMAHVQWKAAQFTKAFSRGGSKGNVAANRAGSSARGDASSGPADDLAAKLSRGADELVKTGILDPTSRQITKPMKLLQGGKS